jgi:predicted  nucleic acid-binding Zn-ribbon protein
MSGSSTFFATLAGANNRNAQGWKANAREWQDYAKNLESEVAQLKEQLAAAENRILSLNAKIIARNRLLEQETGKKDMDAVYAAFGGKVAYEAAVQKELTTELRKQVLGY